MPNYIAEALQASESLDAIFAHGEDMRDSVNANTNKQCNALGSRLENLENLMMGKPVNLWGLAVCGGSPSFLHCNAYAI